MEEVLNDALLKLAFDRVRKTGKTVLINRTPHMNAERLIRENMPDDVNLDDFHTVLYIDYSDRYFVFELSSADPSFKIELINAEPEGNGICDCEYRINGLTTFHCYDDDFDYTGIRRIRIDDEPRDYEKEVLDIDFFSSFAQNLQILYDRWKILNIIFVADCDMPSSDILIDTPQCKAYGHLLNYNLYITTSSHKFILPEDMSYAFYGLTRLMGLWGLENLDTSMVESMEGMFKKVSVLNLDLSGFDTSNVINMHKMFYGAGRFYSGAFQLYAKSCLSHLVLDISNFSTDKVTDMSEMFSYTDYRYVKLGNWCFNEIEYTDYTLYNKYWGAGGEVTFDVRDMSMENLLALIRTTELDEEFNVYNELHLLCNESQTKWLKSEEMQSTMNRNNGIYLEGKEDWYE